jgi:putative hemolysin
MTQARTPAGPFRLDNPFHGLRRTMMGLLTPAIEKALAFDELNAIYRRVQQRQDTGDFCHQVLEELGVQLRISREDLDRIPRSGGLVVVANHPFGGLEGVILQAVLRTVRPDVKLVANYMLQMIPDLRESHFPVDPFGGSGSVQRNIASVRAAMKWVADGHVLGIFPAGEVSHPTWTRPDVVDGKWNDIAARIIRKTGCPAQTFFFHGRNSNLFCVLGLMHPMLRTLMLPREMLKKRHHSITMCAGNVIRPARMGKISSDSELTEYLRMRTYLLQARAARAARPPRRASARRPGTVLAPLAEPTPQASLLHDLKSLPPEALLVVSGGYQVYCFRQSQAPALMREIGRLREIAFRDAGEGSGKPLDLDRFDETYFHLMVWDASAGQIVGSYRAGPTDTIVADQGAAGLYTSTLFNYDRRLLDEMGPALELGRSFVRPEYQRNHSPLSLLWRGIGRYLCLNPHYRKVFGPVSISNEYDGVTRRLLVEFLRQNHLSAPLAELVRAHTPPRREHGNWARRAVAVAARSFEDVDELIAEIEPNLRSAPVLLRQYLNLNGRIIAFNVDRDFGNVIDALTVIDMTKVAPAILVRYFGREQAAQYLRWKPTV